MKRVLKTEEVDNFLRLIYSKAPINTYLKNVQKALDRYEEFEVLKAKLSHISSEQEAVMQYAFEFSKDLDHYLSILKLIPEFSILLEISEVEKENRGQLEKYKSFSLLKEEINSLMKEKQSLIPQLIINKWDNKLSKTLANNLVKEKELKRQANKKRQLWPLRKYLAEFRDILTDVFPCWLLSPETVSDIMPLEKGLFDLIIFDEASQMFVENAIPAIYRSNSIVVAGDDKQLKPTSMFMVRIQEEEEAEDIETAAALEEESLLDLAKVNYEYVHLNYHYRSKYDELINFSNYAFYNGRLEVSPNLIKSEVSMQKPIERILVKGTWLDRKNREEAEKVVELVADILKNRKENETLGIITFNINQKDLIDDMLEEKAAKDMEFRELYNMEISRVDGNEDVSLFVKNIENVQGDERDIIIFSTAYARNEKGKVSVNFGALSAEGGENRLNVAVSRARKKIYVITSIEPEDLEVEGVKNNGPKLLKKYLQYVRAVSEGNKKEAETLLFSLSNFTAPSENASENKGGLADHIYLKLKDLGYEVDREVGVSGYRLDIAIYDKNEGRYTLGIECDDSAFEESDKARERDIHRQRYLESRGWKVIRVWSRDWWSNWKGEIERIQESLK
ncbi:AAA domain-containing protein [Clostridium thermarum]|uniref:AAA domain-containing protein n=1 Tax=Clostridium thermarum TaxID=1716543 RepID=UPI0013D2E1AE|nr:AAA domain-containing protein [Clostridium thermarum]